MKTEYCPSCGAKNLFQLQRPQFCSSCGSAMASAVASQKATPIKKSPPQLEIDDPDGEDIYEVPDISNLQYEIDLSSLRSKRVTLGSLANQRPQEGGQQKLGRRSAPKTRESEDPIAESIRECAPSEDPTDIS